MTETQEPHRRPCPICGEMIVAKAAKCRFCGEIFDESMKAQNARGRNLRDDGLVRLVLPVGRSGWAIAAGYLGLFSVLLLPAPLALFTGIMAVRDIRRNPDKHGMGRAIFGIVMGGITLAFLLFLLVATLVAEANRNR